MKIMIMLEMILIFILLETENSRMAMIIRLDLTYKIRTYKMGRESTIKQVGEERLNSMAKQTSTWEICKTG